MEEMWVGCPHVLVEVFPSAAGEVAWGLSIGHSRRKVVAILIGKDTCQGSSHALFPKNATLHDETLENKM